MSIAYRSILKNVLWDILYVELNLYALHSYEMRILFLKNLPKKFFFSFR